MLLFIVEVSLLISTLASNYTIDDSRGLSRRYDGFGAISGGGATSKLLVNYPDKQKNEILDFLFKPNYGASLHILKVEIGSEAQSSEGTEATHMRSTNDQNYNRGYEWWIMKEAKKRNPKVKLYGLPWGWAGWIGDNVFANPDRAAMYIVNWVLGANSTHDLHIDYVGLWNEKMWDKDYIKVLRKKLDSNGLYDTQIVAADFFGWDIAYDIQDDPELAKAVHVIGVHYPNTDSTKTAVETNKPLWSSEDTATSSSKWNRNYVNGHMTGTIAWPVISSWYPGLPYYPAGLMVASEPWSGHYPEPKLIWLAAHTTQFTEPGWIYFRHGSGVGTFKNGGTYVTLTSPDRKHVTIILETLTKITQLNVWYSNVANDTYFIRKDPMKVTGGVISLSLNVDEMYTLTTVSTGHKGQYNPTPPSEPFPLPFTEDFESYTIGEEPYLFSQQVGGFEVALANDSHHYVMRQVTPQRPVPWCVAEAIGRPITVIGDVTWTDVVVEADFYVTELPHRADGVIIASRLSKGGLEINLAVGVLFNIDTTTQTYSLTTDFVFERKFASGSFNYSTGWNTASLLVKGSTAVGAVNDHTLFTVTDLPDFVSAGFVALGTSGFGQADFDNVKITST